jgi:hypothetical protein
MNDITIYLLAVYSKLDNLQYRLQQDYNGGEAFEQDEEDRIMIGRLLDMLDDLKKSRTTWEGGE